MTCNSRAPQRPGAAQAAHAAALGSRSAAPARQTGEGFGPPGWRRLALIVMAWLATASGAAAQPSLLRQFVDALAAVEADEAEPAAADQRLESAAEDAADAEWLPTPSFEGRLPLAGGAAGEVHLSETHDGLITLRVRDASLSRVLALLAQTQDLNVVAANDIDALISITLRDVPLEEALTAILSVANYTWVQRNNIILVTSLVDAAHLPADVQGRSLQVFELDFARAREVQGAIETAGLLSQAGRISVAESDSADNRKTRELVIVEDIPRSLDRIAAYIYEIDRPPRQVLIEAHILEVNLDDTNRQGVNLAALFRLAGASANIISMPSLAAVPMPTAADPNPSPPQTPAFLATAAGTDFQSVIELLQSTNDTKTLGSPKILVLNEQTARIDVGREIGYKGQLTAFASGDQTQGIEFLPTGVILEVTPRITRDNRVLLRVSPEVSTGEVDGEGIPNKTQTKLESAVMLNDGEGMVIGGLIEEKDAVSQSKVPYLGDIKFVGWFFRRTEVVKQRKEIIIALVPRIQPYDCQQAVYEQGELVRAGVPLFHGPLQRTDRAWDPVLPDGHRVSRPLLPRKQTRPVHGHFDRLGQRYVVPPVPLPEQSFPPPHHAEPRLLPSVEPGRRGPLLSDDGWEWDDAVIIEGGP